MHEFIMMRAARIACDKRRRGAGPAGRSALRAFALLAASMTAPMTDTAAGAPLAASADRVAADASQRIGEFHATLTDRAIVLYMRDVRFNSGSAALAAGATANLEWLVALLKRYPGRTVLIEDYTDTRGSQELKRHLSARRAQVVLAYLRRRGIPAARRSAAGDGPPSPVASNGSGTDRPRNRRIEVVIGDAGVDSR